jgi:hypothetical protein
MQAIKDHRTNIFIIRATGENKVILFTFRAMKGCCSTAPPSSVPSSRRASTRGTPTSAACLEQVIFFFQTVELTGPFGHTILFFSPQSLGLIDTGVEKCTTFKYRLEL